MIKTTHAAMAMAALTLACVAAPPARAAVAVKAGILTCHVDSGWGFIFGSSHGLHCIYSGNGRNEHYAGTISKFGADIGYQESGIIIWDVLAPTTDLHAGALTGDYGGATASASLIVGAGANVLIGGSGREISLQPVSIEGEQGINIAAGIASINLRFTH
jgi:hypothetical protein